MLRDFEINDLNLAEQYILSCKDRLSEPKTINIDASNNSKIKNKLRAVSSSPTISP